MTFSTKKGTLILGIGNDILSDDRIGPKMVTRMKEEGRFSFSSILSPPFC